LSSVIGEYPGPRKAPEPDLGVGETRKAQAQLAWERGSAIPPCSQLHRHQALSRMGSGRSVGTAAQGREPDGSWAAGPEGRGQHARLLGVGEQGTAKGESA
jgi:hypothetical protein